MCDNVLSTFLSQYGTPTWVCSVHMSVSVTAVMSDQATDEAQLMMLKESDYIALFEQIPITVFQHIRLQVPQDGEPATYM